MISFVQFHKDCLCAVTYPAVIGRDALRQPGSIGPSERIRRFFITCLYPSTSPPKTFIASHQPNSTRLDTVAVLLLFPPPTPLVSLPLAARRSNVERNATDPVEGGASIAAVEVETLKDALTCEEFICGVRALLDERRIHSPTSETSTSFRTASARGINNDRNGGGGKTVVIALCSGPITTGLKINPPVMSAFNSAGMDRRQTPVIRRLHLAETFTIRSPESIIEGGGRSTRGTFRRREKTVPSPRLMDSF
ncbi:hypothetical protein GWI33_005379 [Rhynchophorus ferrugineus]|uniref:Uncharacterized protein n=1 Tax=Rhynchophorus ferrugineus TaxID=354439 RepID=A0A834IN37_RHYFE|nr:hypothetical protein GWI33_005379 [Rhynchophorus ferrugineus]